MQKSFRFVLLALLCISQAQAYDLGGIAEQHVLPVYRALAQQTAQLQRSAEDYCASPSPQGLQLLHDHFRDAFLAWQGAQHLRFGPVQYLLREHRFAFWPDKRGSVGKHLAQLLQDPALATDDFDISQKSVAVQGFSALERLLFAASAPTAPECRVVTAIAINLDQMANSLVHDWVSGEEPYLDMFVRPGPDNPMFESEQELAGQLLNSLSTQLELIVTQKLARPLGSGLAKARGKRAEGWRSQTSLASVSANLAACQDLYQSAFAAQLQAAEQGAGLHASIQMGFDQAQRAVARIVLTLPEAVGDSAQRALVEQLQAELAVLQGLVANDLAGALGLTLGFNSLDGD